MCVGRVDPDPKATQKRLEENARELSPEEIRWLELQAADFKNDADARFFAAYMLGLSHREAAIEALGRLALSPIPATKNERLMEQEQAFLGALKATTGYRVTDGDLELLEGEGRVLARFVPVPGDSAARSH